MPQRKSFLLPIDPQLFDVLRRWADDDLRSINAQIEYLLTELLNLLAPLDEPTVLVIDDYHLIHDAAIHASMAFFLQHLSPRLHVVLTSRRVPELPPAARRARGASGAGFQRDGIRRVST